MIPEEVKRKERIGLILAALGTLIGFCIIGFVLFVQLLAGPGDLFIGLALALPAGVMYLTVPRLLDRYDPEPWYLLLGCLAWGAFAATGFSLIPNQLISSAFGDGVGAVVSAPIFEELFKGVGVFGIFYFVRREFDGVVDGIIYGAFVALGFAAIENVLYYSRAAEDGAATTTFFLRGVLFPWGHPVYTAMTGIGFGLAREGKSPFVRMVAPLLGYCAAVFLHFVWNFSATIAGSTGGMSMCVTLPIWFLFVVGFLVTVVILVRRRGRIVREYLEDEVALKNISVAERDLIAHPFATFIAKKNHGPLGVEFVQAGARLALSKWHATRAAAESKATMSADFVAPLRNRLREIRNQFLAAQPK